MIMKFCDVTSHSFADRYQHSKQKPTTYNITHLNHNLNIQEYKNTNFM